jgi:membrane-bound serine protease (ClpP class)
MRPNHLIKRSSSRSTGLGWIAVGLAGLALSLTLSAHAENGADHSAGETAKDQVGAIVSIHDMITDITVDSVRRRIEQAKRIGAKVIVFDMDTPGGIVQSAIAIADMIRELADIKTVAWVNPSAYSGGSLVSVACNEIVMSRSSRIGDSEVIMGGPGGVSAVPDELRAKAFTPVLTDFRQSARLNGYSEVLSEAFVIPEREVWWIENKETGERRFVFRDEKLRLVDGKNPDEAAQPKDEKKSTDKRDEASAFGGINPSALLTIFAADEEQPAPEKTEPSHEAPGAWRVVDKYFDPVAGTELKLTQPVVRSDMLLEMSAGEASAFGFCKAIISDQAGIMKRYGLSSLVTLDTSWSEDLASWMTSIYVRGFLMLIVLLGAYVEFHTPGVGVPGLVALIALAIFVGAPYLSGLANIWELVAILVGVVLLALEIFVIPGFGVAGITGIILLLVGFLGTFVPDEPGRPFPFYLPEFQSSLEWLKQGIIAMSCAMAASLAGMVMLSRYLPRTTLFRRIVPANPTPSDVLVDDEYLGVARIGDTGVTVGPLRPAGKARFGSSLVDVVTQGDYLDRGQRIEVIEHRGNRVVVRAVS